MSEYDIMMAASKEILELIHTEVEVTASTLKANEVEDVDLYFLKENYPDEFLQDKDYWKKYMVKMLPVLSAPMRKLGITPYDIVPELVIFAETGEF